jgi:excisionase family DNA binding protein
MEGQPVVSPWLTVKEAAAYARRAPGTLRSEVKAGRLKAARVGGRGQLLFRREYLDAWLEAQVTPVVVPTWRRA